MPGKSTYQAMRYSGDYQLARSREELRQLEVELPGAFLAWPGDLVALAPRYPVGRGVWRVAEMVCALDEGGLHTRLILGEPDALQSRGERQKCGSRNGAGAGRSLRSWPAWGR